MKFGVLVFPGSNCEHDAFHMLSKVLRQPVQFIWHQSSDLGGCDAIVVPGGFSYGDYLRTGAIARFSPVMEAVKKHAASGGLVIGICNGFQILLESGLLPGAMLKNKGLKYVCRHVCIRVESADTPFTASSQKGDVLRIPVGHMEGNYFVEDATLRQMEENRQVIFRYCTSEGQITEAANPNGSVSNIAGISNEQRNVLGMMPHPERASEALLGSVDGLVIFESMVRSMIHAG
jgi:phosphoribosylformylglycinamidine synthase subunit PurQ / glutaminase